MTSSLPDASVRALIHASRPSPDMEMADQAREVIAHMLGDGRSVLDPEMAIWTGEGR